MHLLMRAETRLVVEQLFQGDHARSVGAGELVRRLRVAEADHPVAHRRAQVLAGDQRRLQERGEAGSGMVLDPGLAGRAARSGDQHATDVVVLLQRPALVAPLRGEPARRKVHAAVRAGVAVVADRLRTGGACAWAEKHRHRGDSRESAEQREELAAGHGITTFLNTAIPESTAPIAQATSASASAAGRPKAPRWSCPYRPTTPSTSGRCVSASVPSTRACSTGLRNARMNT